MRINRLGMTAPIAASVAMMGIAIAGTQPARAHGWSYHSLDQPMARAKSYLIDTKDYLSRTYSQVRHSLSGTRQGEGVVVMKLGLGIPYCKGHAATIGVREGRFFRAVARTRTLRGVRARNIGLMAVTLPPGTYYIVHGRCHTAGRVHNVGLPVRRIAGRPVDDDLQLFRTSYAKFTIEEADVSNAGFLRFFPLRRGKLKIKLQKVPRDDMRFLANRYPDLYDDIRFRLMQRTNAAGYALNTGRPARAKRSATARKAAIARKARAKIRAEIPARINVSKPKNYAPPLIRMPKSTPEQAAAPDEATAPLASTGGSGDASAASLPKTREPASLPKTGETASLPKAGGAATAPAQNNAGRASTMTAAQRSAACKALLQLKRQGKVAQLPVTCLSFGLRGSATKSRGLPQGSLPQAKGKDK